MAEVEVRVRVGRAEDLAAVVALERRSMGAPHWGEAVYRGILERCSPACMARQTGAGESTVVRLLLIAELGGDLAGFLVASAPAAGSVEIESVLVAEELRRRGVGRALCLAVIDWASELGVEAVDLEVRASSGAGQLYRVMGFVAVGRRRRYYREPEEDAVLMRLEV